MPTIDPNETLNPRYAVPIFILYAGEHILYGSQLLQHSEMLRRGMHLGILTATLDYNHVGWEDPRDSIIIRVSTNYVSICLLQAIIKRPDEIMTGQELDRLGEECSS